MSFSIFKDIFELEMCCIIKNRDICSCIWAFNVFLQDKIDLLKLILRAREINIVYIKIEFNNTY